MHKSLSLGKKGQWFLVSTVMASVAFLTISFLFKDYFIVDTSTVAINDEDFYFWDIKDGLYETVTINDFDQPNCERLENRLNEFVYISSRSMSEKGYYLFVNWTIDCPGRDIEFGILLASEDMVVYENVTPGDLVPN